MSKLLDAIKNYITNTTPPWEVCIWTMPQDGQAPHDYSAGYFTIIADNVEYLNQGVVAFVKGGGNEGQFVFITGNIDIVEPMEGGFWFPYHNLKVQVDGFEQYPVVTIRKKT